MLMKIVRKAVTSRLGFFATGATVMYLWDPDRGRSRRAELQQRGGAVLPRMVRKTAARTRSEERYLMQRLEGAMAEVRGGGRFHPESEVDLREHLRQVIHTMRLPGRPVNVDVCEGTVTLRGQVASADVRSQILAAVGGVDGVDRIVDYTHLPGQVAPNKASTLEVMNRRIPG